MITGLAKKLKEKRLEYHMSRKIASENIGISASTLADYENGYSEPSLKILMKLASLYKCSTDYLLGIEKKAPERVLDVTGLSDDAVKALQQVADLMK